jgi:predicted dehydrogenase
MKALFIGLGSIGQRHLRNLKKLRPDIEIMAVRSLRSAPVLSDSNQIIDGANIQKYYGVREFDSLAEALSNKPNIVFITNPTSLHISIAKDALEAGAFIFMEKPISHNYDGVENLIKTEKKLGKNKIFVGYQFRYNPALKLIKKLLKEHRIGNIVGAQLINGQYLPSWHPYEDYRVSYASRKDLGGGALVTQIHDFDYAIWLFGKPERVYAVGGHLSDLEVDVEDSVHVLMQCKKIPISIQLDYLQWPPRSHISIIGDKGTIQCNLTSMEVYINDIANKSIDKQNFPDLNRNDLFLDEMKSFLSFIVGVEDPVVSFLDGAASLRIALAAKNSMLSGNAIKLLWN